MIEKVASIISRQIEGYNVQGLYLVGGTCCLSGIEDIIGKKTGIPTYKTGKSHVRYASLNRYELYGSGNGVKHMEYRIIKPCRGTLGDPGPEKGFGKCSKAGGWDAVGPVQGRLIEMVCAADVAEKSSGRYGGRHPGQLPQHMIMLAIFGDTASVEGPWKKSDGEKRRERRNGNSKTDRKYLGNTKIRPSKRI